MPLQLVLVCGGRGTRFPGRPAGLPKCLLTLHDEPLAGRLLRQLGPRHDSRGPVIVVAAAGDPHVAAWAEGRAQVAFQAKPDGVATAVAAALPHLVDDALVVLGDIVLDGDFLDPWPAAPALGIWRGAPAATTSANYGIALALDRPLAVVEKPVDPAGLVCGIGVYLLTREVIAGFAECLPDARGEHGITDALGHSLAAGIRYGLLELEGRYVNVNTPEDLVVAEQVVG